VTLLGVCWQIDSGERLLPAFIMEASEIGNLKAFLTDRTPSLAEQIGLCIDIASGMSTLHDKGVVHGDIKPENVLIFKRASGSCFAKICDFGSSILVATAGSTCEVLGGTKIWQAPEIQEASGPEALRKADVYSLGLLFWYIFSTDAAKEILDCDPGVLSVNKASGDLLATVMETLEVQLENESHLAGADILQLQQCISSSTLACLPTERWEMEAILNCLFEIVDCMATMDSAASQIGRSSRDKIVQLQDHETSFIEDEQDEDGILQVRTPLITARYLFQDC
jgi:serine/threonine protein kinase